MGMLLTAGEGVSEVASFDLAGIMESAIATVQNNE